MEPIEVSLGDVSLNKVAFLLAADHGIYDKHDLNVRQFITREAADRVRRSGVDVPVEYVRDGDGYDAPISIGGGSPMIVAATSDARAPDRVIVATTDSTARFHIISSPDLTSVDDLRGRRLGYSVYGAVSHLMALSLLQIKGWSPEQDVSLMSEGMSYGSLEAGRVDAFIGSEIYYAIAAKNGAVDLIDLSQYNIPIAGSGINVERSWLAKNRTITGRFVTAMVDAYRLLKADRHAARNAMAKWYGVTDRDQQQRMYDEVVHAAPDKPYPAVEGVRHVMEIYRHRELRRHQPEHFYDVSFVQELDAAGYFDAA